MDEPLVALQDPSGLAKISQRAEEWRCREFLLVGYDPDTVDYSDPALPAGMSAEKIRAGLSSGCR